MKANKREQDRQRRHQRVRLRVYGTLTRPRLNVYRSSAHIYAQLIDDGAGRTSSARPVWIRKSPAH